MSAGVCTHCGRPTESGSEVCSSGCGLARRLPRGDGDLPATWQLGVALAWGFALFNQVLFAGMGLLSSTRSELETAAKFGMASLIVGGLVAVVNVFLFVVAQPKRLTDGLAMVVALLGGLGVWYGLRDGFSEAGVFGFGVFNLLVSVWLGRGMSGGRSSKKGQKG